MKTTFKQYISEEDLPKAENMRALILSIKDGKFTQDGSDISDSNDLIHCSFRDHHLTSLVGCPTSVGNFSCSDNQLTSLEGAPTTVTGDFFCASNKLTSLVGAPKLVPRSFNCRDNMLKTLEGSPQIVLHSFVCNGNLLESFEGAPSRIGSNSKLGGSFQCERNLLKSLKDIHKHIKTINGSASFLHNPIKSHVLGLLRIKGLESIALDDQPVADIINKYLPEGDIFACQQELIDAGLEEYAQL